MQSNFAPPVASRIGRLLGALLALLAVCVAAHAGPTTTAGPYRLEVTTEPPVIPVGKATLHVRLTDAAGKPVTGATIRALTKMPTMNMGEREQTGAAANGEPGV